MSDYKEESNKVKDIKRGIVEPRPMPNHNKRERPVTVEVKYSFFGIGKWKKYRNYRTTEEAEQAIAKLSRKYSFAEYRIKECYEKAPHHNRCRIQR